MVRKNKKIALRRGRELSRGTTSIQRCTYTVLVRYTLRYRIAITGDPDVTYCTEGGSARCSRKEFGSSLLPAFTLPGSLKG